MVAPRSAVSAIVLAAGESLRMGAKNKLLLPFRGAPLIEHTVRTVLASSAAEVIVVLGHEAERVERALGELAVRRVANSRYREGMTTSIYVGVRAAAPDAAGFMICLADLVFVTVDDLDRLIDAFRKQVKENPRCIVVPTFAGRRGNPVVFSASVRSELLAYPGRHGYRGLIEQNPLAVREIPMPTGNVLRDIDTLDEYERVSAEMS